MGGCMCLFTAVPAKKKGLPTAWLTSSALGYPNIEHRLVAEFLKVVLRRKGVLDPKDATCKADALCEKYKNVLATVKVLHINDGNWVKTGEAAREGRAKRATFFWDLELPKWCGVAPENITQVMLYEKPWLFNKPAEEGKYHAQNPNVAKLDPEDQKRYDAALADVLATYNAIKEGKEVPPLPSGRSPAEALVEVSEELEKKYAEARIAWCKRIFRDFDVIVGQGGDVVMQNLCYEINQPFVHALVDAVRSNKVFFATMSAHTMVCAKSIELTTEILPGELAALAVDKKHLDHTLFNTNDLDDEGVQTQVMGALRLFNTPFAMRPHYNPSWHDALLKKNLEAEQEFEAKTHVDVDDTLVQHSADGVWPAIELLNKIAENMQVALEQQHPVFVPLLDGQAIEAQWTKGETGQTTERFRVI